MYFDHAIPLAIGTKSGQGLCGAVVATDCRHYFTACVGKVMIGAVLVLCATLEHLQIDLKSNQKIEATL